MSQNNSTDDTFYDRADSFIQLANRHCNGIGHGKVSASLLFGASRFNSFVVATSCDSGQEMQTQREEAVAYFVGEFRKMLEQNLDDYIENFERYMRSSNG